MDTLEHVLDDEERTATVLRKNGHAHDAELLERVISRVREAAEDYITWLLEPDAMLRSSHAREWFRSRFPAWHEQGHARINERGQREYRQLVVPQRGHASAAREAGRIAGQARARRAG